MAKDPICGMEVREEGAQSMVHIDHETFYFCSEACKEAFEREMGLRKPEREGGLWSRFLTWLSGGAEKEFGKKPPKCH